MCRLQTGHEAITQIPDFPDKAQSKHMSRINMLFSLMASQKAIKYYTGIPRLRICFRNYANGTCCFALLCFASIRFASLRFALLCALPMLEHAWICLNMLACAWICFDMYEHAWIRLYMLEYAWIWVCLNMLGYIHIYIYIYMWICLDMLEYAWICLNMLGPA